MTPDDFDMGRETSTFLTEIRTVLRRAQTAREEIGDDPQFWIEPPVHMYEDPDENGHREYLGKTTGISIAHPGAADAITALDDLIEALAPFARTGKTIRRR